LQNKKPLHSLRNDKDFIPELDFVDEAKAEKFDKQFPYREKLKLPGQLV